jgi:hypothetical protein
MRSLESFPILETVQRNEAQWVFWPQQVHLSQCSFQHRQQIPLQVFIIGELFLLCLLCLLWLFWFFALPLLDPGDFCSPMALQCLHLLGEVVHIPQVLEKRHFDDETALVCDLLIQTAVGPGVS